MRTHSCRLSAFGCRLRLVLAADSALFSSQFIVADSALLVADSDPDPYLAVCYKLTRGFEIELVTPTPAYARSGSEIVGKLAAGGVVLVLEACVSSERTLVQKYIQCFCARRRDHWHKKIVVPKLADLYRLFHFHILFVSRFVFP